MIELLVEFGNLMQNPLIFLIVGVPIIWGMCAFAFKILNQN